MGDSNEMDSPRRDNQDMWNSPGKPLLEPSLIIRSSRSLVGFRLQVKGMIYNIALEKMMIKRCEW